jgi:hypothetical protein
MMTSERKTKELDARLETIEEMLDEIVSRIGLLDEQARHAGYQVQLALRHWDKQQAGKVEADFELPNRTAAAGEPGAVASQIDRRIERLRARL